MAFDSANALAKTYARNKKLLSLRSITNGLQRPDYLWPLAELAVRCTCPLLAKRTCRVALHMSAFGGKADIVWTCRNVRF